MNSTIKGLIKQTTPMKWLLGRLNKLEKALQESRNSDKQMKTQIAKLEKELQEERNSVKRLRTLNDDLRREMKYLHNQGLQPNQYAEALIDWYYQIHKQRLDLEHPKNYNEKMQWLKLYDSTPLKTRLADKYLVREWVAEKIGEEYLIPLLGVWDSFDEIDFNKLPDKFVLKANHGSGWNVIVEDKSKFNMADARGKFRLWMGQNYAYRFGLELHYLNIPPKIVAEEYLEGLGQLYDYKFMCFGGEVKFIWVDMDRFTGHKRVLFTTKWERMDVVIRYPLADREIPKPQNLEKMLELATKLCQGFAHVRVDFYDVNGKVYFGEMTFTSGSGSETITPAEFGDEMGEWIKLPDKSKIPELMLGKK